MTDKQEMELLSDLGKQIKKVRLAKGLSQKELSYTCAIEKSTLSKIENGKVNISYFTLARISKCLEVKMRDLVAD